ncbi:hypothetical protein L249_5801 [Ophiocordyceps polyrhachis-furcata BCC 54312]|uniref:Heat-labile enterotoxin n=1 Tax=Ophiocordyceps polyrhachis-furcata BCC 54312 TaxID=1330021 RepID=A0A367L0B4_9HYPO|nr:hypothetical protein L249_5801 [Ophiocordyceps polyrhachis-furcata BCC 54312]
MGSRMSSLTFLSSCLLLSGAIRAQNGQPTGNRFNYSVYPGVRVFYQGTVSPRDVRRQGGILPRNPQPDDDGRWAYWPTFEAREWLSLESEMPDRIERDGPEDQQDRWLYHIAPSPNMVPADEIQTGIMSLGGILWSQVQHLAMVPYVNGSWRDLSHLRWEYNPDFDPRWLAFGISGPQPLLSGLEPLPEGITTRRQLARTYMNELTGPNNPSLSNEQRHTLRELFDWNPETQPNRDFPLIHGNDNPESLASITVREIDWRDTEMADTVRRLEHRARAGFATDALCFDILSQLRHSTSRFRRQTNKMRQKAEEDPQWLTSLSYSLYNTAMKSRSQPELLNEFCRSILLGLALQ